MVAPSIIKQYKKNHFLTYAVSLGANKSQDRYYYGSTTPISLRVYNDDKGFYVNAKTNLSYNVYSDQPDDVIQLTLEDIKRKYPNELNRFAQNFSLEELANLTILYRPEKRHYCCDWRCDNLDEDAKLIIQGEKKTYLTPSQVKAYLKQQEALNE